MIYCSFGSDMVSAIMQGILLSHCKSSQFSCCALSNIKDYGFMIFSLVSRSWEFYLKKLCVICYWISFMKNIADPSLPCEVLWLHWVHPDIWHIIDAQHNEWLDEKKIQNDNSFFLGYTKLTTAQIILLFINISICYPVTGIYSLYIVMGFMKTSPFTHTPRLCSTHSIFPPYFCCYHFLKNFNFNTQRT